MYIQLTDICVPFLQPLPLSASTLDDLPGGSIALLLAPRSSSGRTATAPPALYTDYLKQQLATAAEEAAAAAPRLMVVPLAAPAPVKKPAPAASNGNHRTVPASDPGSKHDGLVRIPTRCIYMPAIHRSLACYTCR